MKMSNRVYDILKVIALIALPLGALISSLSEIWGFPYGTEISMSLVALDTFLGVILKTSSDEYAKRSD